MLQGLGDQSILSFKLYLAGIETNGALRISADQSKCSNCTLLELKRYNPDTLDVQPSSFKLYLAGIETANELRLFCCLSVQIVPCWN